MREHPEDPFVPILGGAKISDEFGIIERPFAAGTHTPAQALAGFDVAAIVGGGETGTAVTQAGVKDCPTHDPRAAVPFWSSWRARSPGVRVLQAYGHQE